MKFKKVASMVVALILPSLVLASRQLAPEVKSAMKKGAMTEINLRVLDNKGIPVTNASVRVIMDMPSGEYSVFGKTDAEGMYVVRGRTNGNYIEFLVGKDGYYGSRKRITYVQMHAEHEVKDGRWQPYGAKEIVELRKVDEPRQMIKMDKWMEIPRTNTWIGVDLMKNDLTKPFGAGETSDIEVWVEWDGLPPWKSGFCRASMRFPGVLSGGYYADNVCESEYPYPYFADNTLAYAERIVCIVNRDGIQPNLSATRVPFRSNSSLIIRTRCIVDEKGAMRQANYGRIKDFNVGPSRGGVAVCIVYAFNPTPNDTNLEDVETARQSRSFIHHCEPLATSKLK